jgi:hypothetical protein
MKKVLLTLLVIVVVLGVFAAVGYAGYRFGYAQGAQRLQVTANGEVPRPFDDLGPQRMPMHRFEFDRGFERGFGPRGFHMMPVMGFGFFHPLIFLGWILVFGLLIWFVYWLFARSGWRLTRQPAESNPETPKNE